MYLFGFTADFSPPHYHVFVTLGVHSRIARMFINAGSLSLLVCGHRKVAFRQHHFLLNTFMGLCVCSLDDSLPNRFRCAPTVLLPSLECLITDDLREHDRVVEDLSVKSR